MSALSIQQEQRGETLVLTLEGTFDARSARVLAAALDGLTPQRVLLDFGRVRHFSDAGVAVATRALGIHRVQLAGLDRHRERLFRYFGVDSAPAAAPAGESPLPQPRLAG